MDAYIIDFSYVRKESKVIVARDELIDVALKSDAVWEESVWMLLRIAGETFVESFPDKVQKEYKAKRDWNLRGC